MADSVKRTMPEDVSAWMDELTVVGMVLAAVQESPGLTSTSGFTTQAGCFQPKMLASLLACAYALGIFATEDIVEATSSRKGLRYLAGNQAPDAATLKRFRRKHRRDLQDVLSRTLEAVWHRRFSVTCNAAASAHFYLVTSLERLMPDPMVPQFGPEANRRLQLAVMADSISADA